MPTPAEILCPLVVIRTSNKRSLLTSAAALSTLLWTVSLSYGSCVFHDSAENTFDRSIRNVAYLVTSVRSQNLPKWFKSVVQWWLPRLVKYMLMSLLHIFITLPNLYFSYGRTDWMLDRFACTMTKTMRFDSRQCHLGVRFLPSFTVCALAPIINPQMHNFPDNSITSKNVSTERNRRKISTDHYETWG